MILSPCSVRHLVSRRSGLSSLMSRSRWMTPAVSSISSRSLITNQNPENIVLYSDYTDWVQRLVESKARDRFSGYPITFQIMKCLMFQIATRGTSSKKGG